jgi:hypothetical protein
MGRVRRVDVGGVIYHALNRANFHSRLFKTAAHYQDFLAIMEEGLKFVPLRILAYCLMPTTWPLAEPRHYREWLNASPGKEEIENIRYAINRSRPYGSEKWVSKAVGKFGLENTMRNRGRPKKGTCTFSLRQQKRHPL